jgi:pimeloyl-ACP methyl ester carboxylesterase
MIADAWRLNLNSFEFLYYPAYPMKNYSSFKTNDMYEEQPTTAERLMMHYKVSGSGPAVVLVPGGLTGWLSWEPFVPEFNSNTVVQVQLLNVQYGLEDKLLPDDYSVDTESDALLAALQESGINEPADLIGWSYGGLVLLNFALDHPSLVRSITLIEPPAFWVLREHNRMTEESEKTLSLLLNLKNEISEDDLETFLISVGYAQPGESVRNDARWNNWIKYRNSLRQNRVVPLHDDKIERLQSFNRPALLVKGTGSARFLHDAIDTLAEDLPRADVIELPGGHAPHLASMKEFVEAVKQFQQRAVNNAAMAW